MSDDDDVGRRSSLLFYVFLQTDRTVTESPYRLTSKHLVYHILQLYMYKHPLLHSVSVSADGEASFLSPGS